VVCDVVNVWYRQMVANIAYSANEQVCIHDVLLRVYCLLEALTDIVRLYIIRNGAASSDTRTLYVNVHLATPAFNSLSHWW